MHRHILTSTRYNVFVCVRCTQCVCVCFCVFLRLYSLCFDAFRSSALCCFQLEFFAVCHGGVYIRRKFNLFSHCREVVDAAIAAAAAITITVPHFFCFFSRLLPFRLYYQRFRLLSSFAHCVTNKFLFSERHSLVRSFSSLCFEKWLTQTKNTTYIWTIKKTFIIFLSFLV